MFCFAAANEFFPQQAIGLEHEYYYSSCFCISLETRQHILLSEISSLFFLAGLWSVAKHGIDALLLEQWFQTRTRDTDYHPFFMMANLPIIAHMRINHLNIRTER